jgi:hypothetical protein
MADDKLTGADTVAPLRSECESEVYLYSPYITKHLEFS